MRIADCGLRNVFVVLIAACCSPISAATVFAPDVTARSGDHQVVASMLIQPDFAGETISAANLHFSVGEPSDAIPIVTALSRDVWGLNHFSVFLGLNGERISEERPAFHAVLGTVAMIDPLAVPADGTLAVYVLDLSSVPAGVYVLDPDFRHEGVGTTANIPLTFSSGTLTVSLPIAEHASALLGLLAGGVGWLMRRRIGA